MCHHTGDENPGARLRRTHQHCGQDAQRVQTITDELRGIAVRRDPGRPQIGHRPLKPVHTRQKGCDRRHSRTDLSALKPIRTGLRNCPGGPQRLTSSQPEAVERSGCGQRLHLSGADPAPANHVGHADERTSDAALGDDAFGRRGPNLPDPGKAQPNRRLVHNQPQVAYRPAAVAGTHRPTLNGRSFQRSPGQRQVDVGTVDHDPMATGVRDQALRRVEPHRLRVQQRRAEGRRIVEIHP